MYSFGFFTDISFNLFIKLISPLRALSTSVSLTIPYSIDFLILKSLNIFSFKSLSISNKASGFFFFGFGFLLTKEDSALFL